MGPGKAPPPPEKTNAEKTVGFKAPCPFVGLLAFVCDTECDYDSPRTKTPGEAQALLHEHLQTHAAKCVRVVWE